MTRFPTETFIPIIIINYNTQVIYIMWLIIEIFNLKIFKHQFIFKHLFKAVWLLYLFLLLFHIISLSTFPTYDHICNFPAVSHTTQDLIFLWNTTDPLVVNPEIELPQLDISNNYTTDCTIEYSTGNFTCIQIVFNLRRRLGYHLFHTYIPSALIVVMSWIAFWIKPEAIPARVTLGVTSLLTLGKTTSPISIVRVNYSWYLRLR